MKIKQICLTLAFYCFLLIQNYAQNFLPPSEAIDSFQENNTLGSAAPMIMKTSPALKNNPAFSSFYSMDDFSFGYKLGSLPDTFIGGIAFKKDALENLALFGHFDLFTAGDIANVRDGKLTSVTGFQSYSLRPGFSYKFPHDMSLSTDMEFLIVDVLDQKNFSYNLSLGYAKVWPKLKIFTDTSLGLYVKNVLSPVWEYASPFTLGFNASTTMWKGYFSMGLGFRYVPELDGLEAYNLDVGISSFFLNMFRLNVGYLNVVSDDRIFNLGFSFLYRNFQISYGINNVTQNSLSYSDGGVSMEHVFSLNIFYKGAKIVSSKRKLKSMRQINDLARLAEEQVKAQKYKDAIESYEKILVLDRGNIQALSRIDEIDETIGTAIEEYNKKGKSTFKQERFADSLGFFQKSLFFDEEEETANKYIKIIKDKIKRSKKKHYALAQLHFKNANYDEALRNVEATLLADPKDQDVIKLKTEIVQKLEIANQEKEKRLKGFQLLAMGDKALSEGDYDKAEQILQKAKDYGLDQAALDPYFEKLKTQKNNKQRVEEANSFYFQAQEAFEKKQIDAGVQFLAKAMTAYPDHKEAKLSLAKYKKKKKALVDQNLNKGMQAFQNNKYVEAKEHWSTVKAVDKAHPKITQYLSMLNTATDRFFKSSLKKGKAYLKSKSFVDAKSELSTAYQFKPENEEVKKLLKNAQKKINEVYDKHRAEAISLFNDGNLKVAKTAFLKIKQELKGDKISQYYIEQIDDKLNTDNYFQEANTFYANRNFAKAKEAALKLQKINPDYPGLEKILKEINAKVLEENRDEILATKFQQGVNAFKQKKFEDAIAKWEEIKKIDPNNDLVIDYINRAKDRQQVESDKDFTQGQNAFAKKDWLLARTSLRKAIQSNPNNEKAKALLVEVDFALEDIQKKERVEAKQLYDAGKYKDAKEKYALLVQIDAKDTASDEMAERIALIEDLRTQADKAEKDDVPLTAMIAYQSILEINSQDILSARKIAGLSSRIDRMKGQLLSNAEDHFKNKDYKLAIDNWQALIGANLIKGAQKNNIVAQIEKAVNLKKDQVENLKDRGRSALNSRNYSNAFSLYKQALSIDPTNIALRKKVQEVQRALNEVARKKANAKRVNTIVIMDKGLAAYKSGDNRLAIKHFQEIIATNPNDQQAKEFLNRARTKLQLQGK